MKTVLLLVHDDEGQEARLQAALDVTRAISGHLACIDVAGPPAILPYDMYYTPLAVEIAGDERDRRQIRRARIEERLVLEGVAWNWDEFTGSCEDAIHYASEFTDLVVLTSRLGNGDASKVVRSIAETLYNAPCPLLAVPGSLRHFDPAGVAVIAWDGSREADKALREAVPLLALAREVVLLTIGPVEGDFAANSAATYLSRHDVHARIQHKDLDEQGHVYSTLLDYAHGAGAAYIVMGGFGHSPGFESIFGGVTRSMLAHSDLPLLLAH